MKITKQTNTKGGFTLIEILVVIGIIAVLATVVLVAINPARQFAQANNSQRTSNVNAILNAVGQYMADNQGDLPSGITSTASVIGTTLCENIVPTYMPSLPSDPKSSFEGASIKDCDTITSTSVDYKISKDANVLIKVCAPNAANEDALEDAEEICITR